MYVIECNDADICKYVWRGKSCLQPRCPAGCSKALRQQRDQLWHVRPCLEIRRCEVHLGTPHAASVLQVLPLAARVMARVKAILDPRLPRDVAEDLWRAHPLREVLDLLEVLLRRGGLEGVERDVLLGLVLDGAHEEAILRPRRPNHGDVAGLPAHGASHREHLLRLDLPPGGAPGAVFQGAARAAPLVVRGVLDPHVVEAKVAALLNYCYYKDYCFYYKGCCNY